MAQINVVQTGSYNHNANGNITQTITSVATGQSFLVFTTRTNTLDRPVTFLRGTITNATTITFTRNTNEATPVEVTNRWYVVEFSSGVTTQRGTGVAQDLATKDVTITAVAGLAQAFANSNGKTPVATDSLWSSDDPARLHLPNTTTYRSRAGVNAGHTFNWEVVEWTNAADVNVQDGDLDIASSTTEATATITAVVLAKTFTQLTYESGHSNNPIHAPRSRLNSTTQVSCIRVGTPADVENCRWLVVELEDDSSVQTAGRTLAAGSSTDTFSVTSVDTARSHAMGSAMWMGVGHGAGGGSYSATDRQGACHGTFTLDSATQITAERIATNGTWVYNWHLVEWAGVAVAVVAYQNPTHDGLFAG